MYKILSILLIAAIFLFQASAQPPDEYDLRDHNLVTPVKSQKGGTCWLHGSMSTVEGNLLKTGNWAAAGETGTPNMAEYHLEWWNGFNKHCNYDLFPDTAGDGLSIAGGGDYRVFTSYMSRLIGPIREKDAPGDGSNHTTHRYPMPRDKSSYHRFYVMDVEFYTAGVFYCVNCL